MASLESNWLVARELHTPTRQVTSRVWRVLPWWQRKGWALLCAQLLSWTESKCLISHWTDIFQEANPFCDKARGAEICTSQAEVNTSDFSFNGMFPIFSKSRKVWYEIPFQIQACHLFQLSRHARSDWNMLLIFQPRLPPGGTTWLA